MIDNVSVCQVRAVMPCSGKGHYKCQRGSITQALVLVDSVWNFGKRSDGAANVAISHHVGSIGYANHYSEIIPDCTSRANLRTFLVNLKTRIQMDEIAKWQPSQFTNERERAQKFGAEMGSICQTNSYTEYLPMAGFAAVQGRFAATRGHSLL